MRRLALLLTLLATLSFIVACGSDDGDDLAQQTSIPTPTPSSDQRVGEDGRFTLTEGELKFVDDTGFKVRFEHVTQDSRCPVDVQCVVAGSVTVRVSISEKNGEPDESYLFSIGDPRPEPSVHTIGEYQVELLEMEPSPGAPVAPKTVTMIAWKS